MNLHEHFNKLKENNDSVCERIFQIYKEWNKNGFITPLKRIELDAMLTARMETQRDMVILLRHIQKAVS